MFAVGDPDQAIYRFRGATSGAFDQFLKTFGPDRVKRVTLSKNRRSTPPILRCAYQTIGCNPTIASMELRDGGWPREPLGCARLEDDPALAHASPVRAVVHNGFEQEAIFVADTIVGHARATARDEVVTTSQCCTALMPIARRCSPNFASATFPCTCKASIFSTPRRPAMPWRRCRSWSRSDPIALVRVAAFPQFNVDPEEFRAALALAGKKASIESVLEKVPGGFAVMESVREARHDLANANGFAGAGDEDCATRIPTCRTRFRCGVFRNWPSSGATNPSHWWGREPCANFSSMSSGFARRVDALPKMAGRTIRWRRWRPPTSAVRPPEDAVQLMTVHAAKGLEFPCVFVLRVASPSFPHNYKEPLVEFPQQLRSKETAAEESAQGASRGRRAPSVLRRYDARRGRALPLRQRSARRKIIPLPQSTCGSW